MRSLRLLIPTLSLALLASVTLASPPPETGSADSVVAHQNPATPAVTPIATYAFQLTAAPAVPGDTVSVTREVPDPAPDVAGPDLPFEISVTTGARAPSRAHNATHHVIASSGTTSGNSPSSRSMSVTTHPKTLNALKAAGA